MTRRPLFVLATAIVLAAPATVLAQTQPVTVGARVGGVPGGGYDDGGRRDPFVSLVAPKRTAAPAPVPARPATGLAAVAVNDIIVKGIVKSGATLVAILEAPDGKGYIARRQDKLQDATIKSIDATGVVFAAQVIDVEGSTRVRDVRKGLHALEVIK